MWKWLGHKEFIPGVPARDLTDEEVDRRGITEIVEMSPLYQYEEAEEEAAEEIEEKEDGS